MRVAVVGSRAVKNFEAVCQAIMEKLPQGCSEIVSGGADGVDAAAKEVAGRMNIVYTAFLPDYERYGRQAPLKRNTQIVDYADYVLAFWDYCSSGTKNTLSEALRLHKQLMVVGI